jgi:hypothetical protein
MAIGTWHAETHHVSQNFVNVDGLSCERLRRNQRSTCLSDNSTCLASPTICTEINRYASKKEKVFGSNTNFATTCFSLVWK